MTLTNEEFMTLFRDDYPQLLKILDIESRNEKRACYRCFRLHSDAEGHLAEIPNTWIAD